MDACARMPLGRGVSMVWFLIKNKKKVCVFLPRGGREQSLGVGGEINSFT